VAGPCSIKMTVLGPGGPSGTAVSTRGRRVSFSGPLWVTTLTVEPPEKRGHVPAADRSPDTEGGFGDVLQDPPGSAR
jgi:hypothetical protein